MQAQLRSMLLGQSPGSGDVIGMNVRVDNVAQGELPLPEQRVVLLDLNGRIDDRRLARLPGGDEIGRAPNSLVEDLLEIHRGTVPMDRWKNTGQIAHHRMVLP